MSKEFVNWEADALVTKAYQDDKGKMHVIAVASDDGIDLQKDQMTTDALEKMAAQALKGVPLLESHRSTFEFGKSVHGTVGNKKDEDGKIIKQLVVDVELDGEFPQSRKLFKEIQSGGCARQLSIGGKLNLKNKSAISIEMTNKGLVRKIHDLDLDHIACTRQNQAANPRTNFVEALMKSIDEAGGFDGIAVKDVRKQDETGTSEDTGDKTEDTPKPDFPDANGEGNGGNGEDEPPKTETETETDSGTESTGSLNPEEFAQDAARGAGLLAAVGRLFKKSLTGEGTMVPGKKEGKDVSNIKKVGEVVGAVSPNAAKPGVKEEDVTTKESCKKTWPGMDSTTDSSSGSGSGSDSSSGSDSGSGTTTTETKESSSGSTTTSGSTSGSSSGSNSDSSSGSGTTTNLTSISKAEAFAGAAPPFKAEDAKEEDSTPEEEEAAKVLMRRRLNKQDAVAEGEEEETPAEDEEQMVREIAILLSKAHREGLLTKSPKDQVIAEAVKGALWNIRYLLAKQVSEEGAAGDAAGAVAALIVDGGLYAPTTESAGQPNYADDKAAGDAAVAPVAVTDHRNLPVPGGEVAVTAPTIGQSMAAVKSAQEAANALPQRPDSASFAKSLQEETVNKSVEAAGNMILKATEAVIKSNNEQLAVITKALEGFDSRLASIEKVGVSQSGPRGVHDAVIVEKSSGSPRNAWGGIFTPAAKQATQRM